MILERTCKICGNCGLKLYGKEEIDNVHWYECTQCGRMVRL